MSTLPVSSLSQHATSAQTPLSRQDKGKKGDTSAREALRFGFEDLSARIEHVGEQLQGVAAANALAESESGSAGRTARGAEHVWRVVVKRLEGTGDLELVAQRYDQLPSTRRAQDRVNGSAWD